MADAKTIRQTLRFHPGVEVVFSRTLRGNRLAKFRIQFRMKSGSSWHNVLRYDHAHGPVHRHECWLPGEPSTSVGPFKTLDDALEWCLADLESSAASALTSAKASYTKKVNIVGDDHDQATGP